MMDSDFFGALSEQDYRAIVAFNKRLVECRRRSDFNGLLHDQLLPLLQSSSCTYLFTEPDLSQMRIYDSINVPQETLALLPQVFASDPIGHHMLRRQRSVMAYDVDFDRKEIEVTRNRFFLENPQPEPLRRLFLDAVRTVLVALNIPDATVAFVCHRLSPEDSPYTIREVRILELLWPVLVQTIRSILLSEELNRYRSFADSLAAVAAPVALIDLNWRMVFRNAAFDSLFAHSAGDRLPDDLARVIRREISRHQSEKSAPPPPEIAFYQFERRSFRIVLTRIEVNPNDETLWLVRLDRIVDGYLKMLRLLQEKGLTAREIEICLLLNDGMGIRQIADRLCISYNTARNHLQSIHRKIGVTTQVQLSAYLNKQQE